MSEVVSAVVSTCVIRWGVSVSQVSVRCTYGQPTDSPFGAVRRVLGRTEQRGLWLDRPDGVRVCGVPHPVRGSLCLPAQIAGYKSHVRRLDGLDHASGRPVFMLAPA